MNKTILGITLAAVFAVSMISLQSAIAGGPPPYMSLTNALVTEPGNGNRVLYSAYSVGAFPQVPDEFIDNQVVVGVGWLNGDLEGTFATIHPGAVDSRQNPNLWHPHTGTLAVHSGALCVETLQSPNAGISITDNMINVNMNSGDAAVDSGNFAFAAAFTLAPNSDCPPIEVDLPGQGFPPAPINEDIVPNLPGLEVTVISAFP